MGKFFHPFGHHVSGKLLDDKPKPKGLLIAVQYDPEKPDAAHLSISAADKNQPLNVGQVLTALQIARDGLLKQVTAQEVKAQLTQAPQPAPATPEIAKP